MVPRRSVGKAIRNYIDTHSLSPKGVTLAAEVIREGLIAVLSVFVQEPQFQGQTEDRLNNPEVDVGGRPRRSAPHSSADPITNSRRPRLPRSPRIHAGRPHE